MRLRAVFSLLVMSTLATVGATGVPASAAVSTAAAASVKAAVVNGNAGTLKVTGSNFTKNANLIVEFNQNGANSGNLTQRYSARSDGSGRFTLTAAAYVSASCLVGVAAWDDAKSASTNLNTTGKGCQGGKVAINPCQPVCTDFYTQGSGFTPGATVDVFYEFQDGAKGTVTLHASSGVCGTLAPGRYPPAPAGQFFAFGACNGYTMHDDRVCHAPLVKVWAEEQDTDYISEALYVDPRC
jgi:hypothetical protein